MIFQVHIKLAEHKRGYHLITVIIEKKLSEISGLPESGLLNLFIQHTSAALTINENADPDVVYDILSTFQKVFPKDSSHRHMEGNSHAHIKASLMGSSCTIIIENGVLKLGTWQGVYFCEFDGPRTRGSVTNSV